MTTLTVNIKNGADSQKIADAVRLLRGVEKVAITPQPMCRMTVEEFNEMIDESLEDARQGRLTSHKDFKNEMAQW